MASEIVRAAHSGYGATFLDTLHDWPDGAATWDRCAPLLLRQVAYLVDKVGMDPMAIQRDGDGMGWPLVRSLVAPVSADSNRKAPDTFEWLGDGAAGVLMMVARGPDGCAADHVAIDLRTGWCGTEGGGVAMLGEHEIREDMRDDALMVHETAVDWLKAGRRGVAILDRRRSIPMLRDAGPLLVSNTAWGMELDKMLRLPGPDISVAIENPAPIDSK